MDLFFLFAYWMQQKLLNHRERLDEIEIKYGQMHYHHKPYMLMNSAAEIARNPALLDTVEDLLGPDILLWDGAYVIKEPRNTKCTSYGARI